MVIVKILKRRDAASVVVAIILATFIGQAIQMETYFWGNRIAHLGEATPYNGFGVPNQSWRDQYVMPIVTLILSLIVLEVLLWVVVWLHPFFVRKRK